MTNFNFKFLGAWLVIVASITGLQAQNDSTLKGKDEMVPAICNLFASVLKPKE